MNELFFLRGDQGTGPVNLPALATGMLLAFLLGQTLAWIYMITHSGLSYSRSFVRSLVVTPIIVCVVMVVLINNLVTAFGLLAVFAIVRFRNVLRDTLDTSYVLLGIVAGMACGTQKYSTAVLGVIFVCLVLLYLWSADFGSRHRYDLIVSFQWRGAMDELSGLKELLQRHGRHVALANQRVSTADGGMDVSYRLLMRDPERLSDLVSELGETEGLSQLSAVRAEDESEL